MSGLTITALSRPHLAGPIDAEVPAGAITALCGPNGSGKTTFIRALAGLTEGAGAIRMDGRVLSSVSRSERARRIAYLPAERRAEWPLRVRDAVGIGLSPGAADIVEAALSRTETRQFAHRRIDTLSTGERARVLLARVLAQRPDVLLLDEPAANLDPAHQLDVMTLLREEAARGAAVLVSLHDLQLARGHADHALLLSKGRLAACGAAEDALSPGRVADIFGVRSTVSGWVRA